jgi:tetratricopeptide (TPR) repeat protein
MEKWYLTDTVFRELATLGQFSDLAQSVRRIQEKNSISAEDLRNLVHSVGHYRTEGRIDVLQTIVAHAMRIAEALGSQRLLAELANIQGMNHFRTRQFEQAELLFSQAAQLWAEEAEPQEQGRSLINLAEVYFATGDATKAKEMLEKALALSRLHGLMRLEAQALGFIGLVIFRLQTLYEEARPYYERARELYDHIGDEEGVQKIDYRLAELLFVTVRPEPTLVDVDGRQLSVSEMTVEEEIGKFMGGRSQEFTLHAYVDQLAQAREQHDAALEIDSLCALADMHSHLGHVQEAIACAIEACAVAERAGTSQDQVRCQMHLANTYYNAGDANRAKEVYQRCLGSAERLQNPRLLGGALLALGVTERDYFAKLAYYDRAYPVFRDIGDERNTAVVLTNGAIAHLDIAESHWTDEECPAQENLENALMLLGMATDIWEKLGATNEVASVITQKARLYLIQRDFARGVERLQKALSVYQTVNNEAGQVMTLDRLGQAHWAQGEQEKAVSTLARAIGLMESRFDTLVAESVQMSFMGQSSRLYADMIGWCRLDRPAEAFEYLERSRSRAFLDLMGDTEILQPASIQNTDIGREEIRLRQQLSALRLEFARQSDNGAEVVALWRRYAQTNEELNRTLEAMDDSTDEVAAYMALRRSVPLTLKEVKACLQDG